MRKSILRTVEKSGRISIPLERDFFNVNDFFLLRQRSISCNIVQVCVNVQATAGDKGMTMFYVCCNPNCGHRWRD